jgi:hypothetical protein
VSSDGLRVPTEERASPRCFLVGEELDWEITNAGLSLGDFLGATLPPIPEEGTALSLTFCLKRQRGPVDVRPLNCEPITRRIKRDVPVPHVPNPLLPCRLPPFGLLLSQLKTLLSLFGPSRWRDPIRRELSCAPCFPLADLVTTLAVCACWRLQESYLGRPRGAALRVRSPTQRAVPGRSSPMPTRMGTIRLCGVSEWSSRNI